MHNSLEQSHNRRDRDATLVKFHTTFHFNDPLNQKQKEPEKDNEIMLLKEELKYAKQSLQELRKERHKDKKGCQQSDLPKCQVCNNVYTVVHL